MLISPALAFHDTMGSGTTMGAILPLIVVAAALRHVTCPPQSVISAKTPPDETDEEHRRGRQNCRHRHENHDVELLGAGIG